MHTAQYSVVPPSRTNRTVCGGTPCLEQSAIELETVARAHLSRLGSIAREIGLKQQ